MLREMHEVKYLDFGDGVDLVEIVVRSVTYITCGVLEFGKEGKWGMGVLTGIVIHRIDN